MRLIDADNALELFRAEYQNTKNLIKQGEKHLDSLAEGYTEAAHIIKHISPTVDAVPVVHGRWIEQEDQMLDVYYTCSACKEDFYIETTGYTEKDLFLYTYCPNCGAKMDGGADHEAD